MDIVKLSKFNLLRSLDNKAKIWIVKKKLEHIVEVLKDQNDVCDCIIVL